MTLPIGHILPLGAENRWSDLLAVLVEADPVSASPTLGLGERPHGVGVRREARGTGRDRLDLLIYVDDEPRTKIEVKVLSGLRADQLRRYREARPHVDHHIVIFPERLPVDLAAETGWRGVTWEGLLSAFRESASPWVAETAGAWLAHLERTMPRVDAGTRWNDLDIGEDFAIAVRARMAWVFGELRPPESITHDLVVSGAGNSAVARMYRPAADPEYRVIVEAEENLSVREYPTRVTACSKGPRGPSIKVCLLQTNVSTSADFDWDYPSRRLGADGSRTHRLGHDTSPAQGVTRSGPLESDDRSRRTSTSGNRVR